MKRTLPLLALLLAYVLVIFIVAPDGLHPDDEVLYARFADRLTHGHYSPPGEVDLWFGPGYPAVLAVFDGLNLSWLAARLLNALLLCAGLLYFDATLRLYAPEAPTLLITLLLGLYPPFWVVMVRLYAETLALFLIFGAMYHFCRFHRAAPGRRAWGHALVAGGCLAYLALAKVFFGYVLLIALLVFAALYVIRRQPRFLRSAAVFAIGLVLCTPYLAYTYDLTGQLFYWGNSGGMSLYWMASPYDGDLGDWHARKHFDSDAFIDMDGQMADNHRAFFDEVEALDGVARDRAFLRRGLENIRDHPFKYVQNWAANVGRLLFSYPYSYTPQKLSTYIYLLPDVFLVALGVFSLVPSWIARRRIPYEICALLLVGGIAFGGSSLLSAFNRQFVPIVPFLALWLAFVWTRLARVTLRPAPEEAASAG